jgi:hypothetical protein
MWDNMNEEMSISREWEHDDIVGALNDYKLPVTLKNEDKLQSIFEDAMDACLDKLYDRLNDLVDEDDKEWERAETNKEENEQ